MVYRNKKKRKCGRHNIPVTKIAISIPPSLYPSPSLPFPRMQQTTHQQTLAMTLPIQKIEQADMNQKSPPLSPNERYYIDIFCRSTKVLAE